MISALLRVCAQRRWLGQRPALAIPPRRVIIIRPGGLGDLICALPLYRTLEALWPECRLDWLLGPRNAALAPFLRSRGQSWVLPPEVSPRWWLPGTFLRRLQASSYDLAINAKPGFDSANAWLCLATGAAERRGCIDVRRARLLNRAYSHPLPPPASMQHQVKKCLALLQGLGSECPSGDTSLDVPETARARMQERLHEQGIGPGRPMVSFQITTTKRSFMHWPAEHFIALGRRISAHATVMINAAPEERAQAESLAQAIGGSARAACFTEMADYLAFHAAAAVVVGADGGGIHMAAAVGAHTIAFYSEASPVKWRPWQGDHVQFHAEGKPIAQISPEQAWQAVEAKGWLPPSAHSPSLSK